MIKSERLFSEGLIETNYHGEMSIIKNCNEYEDLRCIATEDNVLCNGRKVSIDIHETPDNVRFAIINKK
jgi:hypothetical protein